LKRARIALSVAALGLLLLPAAALAVIPGTKDVDVEPGGSTYLADWNLMQTYKAGLTGHLTAIEIYCGSDVATANGPSETISVGSETATGTCPDSMGWAYFQFSNPPAQVAGQTYTIAIQGGAPTRWGVAASDYGNGELRDNGGNLVDVSDVAFITYVEGSTAPPTSTVTGHAPATGSALWLLPASLAFALGALIVIRRRTLATRP
jgi:hypothetical protein